jgi:ethanolamine transporter EutH
MNNPKTEFLKSILNNKKNLIELIAAAILIGLGVNFIASGIFEYFHFNNKSLAFIFIGFIFTIIGFIYYLNKFFGKKKLIIHKFF